MMVLRRYKVVALFGLAMAAAGLLPVFLYPLDLSIAQFEVLLGIVSIGCGAVFPITTVSIQNSVARHDLGTAMSLITFSRNLGAAAGVALFGAIVAGLTMSGADAGEVAGTFRYAFLLGTGGFALAFVLLLFMDERSLTGASGQMT
jgi:MFS family permease